MAHTQPITPDPAEREAALQPWQFFLLGGMMAATAAVVVANGQSPGNVIILSLTVVAVSSVGIGAYRMLLPLVSPGPVDTPALIGGRTRLALDREKSLVLRSIKELEFDFAMGKMSQADFDDMSNRLRQRALGLMRQLDAGGGYREQIEREVARRLGEPVTVPSEAGPEQVPDRPANRAAGRLAPGSAAGGSERSAERPGDSPGERACACGTRNDPDARFCKSCGSQL